MTCAERGYQIKEPENNGIQLFEDQKIRVAWGAEREEWYFSIVDVVGVLTDSPDYNTGRKYWNKLKQRLKEEGSELVTNCHQLKMRAADGKNRLTDVADTEQLLMSMQDWLDETDRFLENNRRKVLDGKGGISREAATKKVGAIYDQFRKLLFSGNHLVQVLLVQIRKPLKIFQGVDHTTGIARRSVTHGNKVFLFRIFQQDIGLLFILLFRKLHAHSQNHWHLQCAPGGEKVICQK